MILKTFTSKDVHGKKVLMRVDFNVPLKDGGVADDTRIRASLKGIEDLRREESVIGLLSHLGRPKGKDPAFSLAPVCVKLSELLGFSVRFVEDCIGAPVEDALQTAKGGDVLLLENVRFYPEEEKNDPIFARNLASPFDVFVMDAFSAAHRAHASTKGVTSYLPSFAGPQLVREVEILSQVRDHPALPFVLLLGGAKVSDKIGVLENLLERATKILIGGGMAFTFLKAKGYSIGRSLCEPEKLDFASKILDLSQKRHVEILLPEDVMVASEIGENVPAYVVPVDAIPEDAMGLDIGPQSLMRFKSALMDARTVLWNGPMGVYEIAPFSCGTRGIAETLAEITKKGALTVVGGGDSAAAIMAFGLGGAVSHVSTGGGATLEFFEGKTLPGIEPLIVK